MTPEQREQHNARMRTYRARRRQERESARLHEALHAALTGAIGAGSPLGQVLATMRQGLLEGIAAPSEAHRTLADLAVRCKLQHDSLAAYLDSRPVQDRLDSRVLALEIEARQQAQTYAKLTRELRAIPSPKPAGRAQWWIEDDPEPEGDPLALPLAQEPQEPDPLALVASGAAEQAETGMTSAAQPILGQSEPEAEHGKPRARAPEPVLSRQ